MLEIRVCSTSLLCEGSFRCPCMSYGSTSHFRNWLCLLRSEVLVVPSATDPQPDIPEGSQVQVVVGDGKVWSPDHWGQQAQRSIWWRARGLALPICKTCVSDCSSLQCGPVLPSAAQCQRLCLVWSSLVSDFCSTSSGPTLPLRSSWVSRVLCTASAQSFERPLGKNEIFHKMWATNDLEALEKSCRSVRHVEWGSYF